LNFARFSADSGTDVSARICDGAPNQGVQVLQILVRDNNVDQALRVLKKKMQREGIFREMKRRRFYEKPSERIVRRKADSVRRARKAARKKAQYEGLLADPRKKRVAVQRASRHS
jgi:small subunit ribosomal protein S21